MSASVSCSGRGLEAVLYVEMRRMNVYGKQPYVSSQSILPEIENKFKVPSWISLKNQDRVMASVSDKLTRPFQQDVLDIWIVLRTYGFKWLSKWIHMVFRLSGFNELLRHCAKCLNVLESRISRRSSRSSGCSASSVIKLPFAVRSITKSGDKWLWITCRTGIFLKLCTTNKFDQVHFRTMFYHSIFISLHWNLNVLTPGNFKFDDFQFIASGCYNNWSTY